MKKFRFGLVVIIGLGMILSACGPDLSNMIEVEHEHTPPTAELATEEPATPDQTCSGSTPLGEEKVHLAKIDSLVKITLQTEGDNIVFGSNTECFKGTYNNFGAPGHVTIGCLDGISICRDSEDHYHLGFDKTVWELFQPIE